MKIKTYQFVGREGSGQKNRSFEVMGEKRESTQFLYCFLQWVARTQFAFGKKIESLVEEVN